MTGADVVVVGAGPAGLACAVTAVRHGLTVDLVDAGWAVGGQYWRHPAPVEGADGAGAVTAGEVAHLHHDLPTYRALCSRLEEAVAAGRARTFLGHEVWTVGRRDGGWEVAATQRRAAGGRHAPGGGELRVAAPALVVATGAYDTSLPFRGWDLPGVMTAGGLQALLKGHAVAAGRRVAVAGSGPFLLPVAVGLAESGAEVVGVYEANPPTRWGRHLPAVARNVAKLAEGAEYAAALARHRIPLRTGRMVVEALGTDRVEAVTVARLDATGRPRPDGRTTVAVDAVGVGWGFTPVVDLAVTAGCATTRTDDGRHVVAETEGRTSVEGVYTAGETTGVGGAALALAEGERTAYSVLADRTGHDPDAARLRHLDRRIAALRSFAAAMAQAHAVPAGWVDATAAETLVCRCEEVPRAAVDHALRDREARDARQVKQLTRAGMGWCQGRVCEAGCRALVADRIGRPDRSAATERLVAMPVRMRDLLGTP
ncbi:putative oxidase [Nostocoides japonicum T1-X7]|uniref:Putative oxidase n=1 Tax=Nostocoides japonicum T1-X7 TaxID=1194083 RepID=A0A077LTG4_9MICO|nr:NAD(P)/FAD-dependent oxidoreductase [Tetrasphaera japonica]CCH76496.1 putative oxidase [Tetrasphaera japonica T1-X7]